MTRKKISVMKDEFAAGHPDQLFNSVCFDPHCVTFLLNSLQKEEIRELIKSIKELSLFKNLSKEEILELIEKICEELQINSSELIKALTADPKRKPTLKEIIDFLVDNAASIDDLIKVLKESVKKAKTDKKKAHYEEACQKIEFTLKQDIKKKLKEVRRFLYGCIYFDRLRFRFADVVPGEHIYSVSLSPNEEVTIAHKSITKRTKEFERIITREDERNLEFSSTWSTDIMNGVTRTESESKTEGWNVGGSVSYSDSGFTGAILGGYSSSTTESESKTVADQTRRMKSVTSKTSNRMRTEHKTTIKLAEEVTEESLFKRFLRNDNPSRPVTYLFYKLYNKYRVILERFDAAFGLRFTMIDPAKNVRDDFYKMMENYDPNTAATQLQLQDQVFGPLDTDVTFLMPSIRLESDDDGDLRWVEGPPNRVDKSVNLNFNQDCYVTDIRVTIIQVNDTFEDDSSVLHAAIDGFGISVGVKYPETLPVSTTDKTLQIQIEVRSIPLFVGVVGVRIEATYISNDQMQQHDERINEIKETFKEEGAQYISHYLDVINDNERRFLFKDIQNRFVTQFIQQSIINIPLTPEEIQNMNFGDFTPRSGDIYKVFELFDWEKVVVQWHPWWETDHGKSIHSEMQYKLAIFPELKTKERATESILTASYANILLPFKDKNSTVAFFNKYIFKEDMSRNPILNIFLNEINDFYRYVESNFTPRGTKGDSDYLDPRIEPVTELGEVKWKYEWELPVEKVKLLNDWHEFFPTDGIHIEPVVSRYDSVDDFKDKAERRKK